MVQVLWDLLIFYFTYFGTLFGNAFEEVQAGEILPCKNSSLNCLSGFTIWPWISPGVVLTCTVVYKLASKANQY